MSLVERSLPPASGWGMHEVRNAAGLSVQVLGNGAVHALRQGATLINQLLPGPAEEGLLRVLARFRSGNEKSFLNLAGAGVEHHVDTSAGVRWIAAHAFGLEASTTLTLDPTDTAWTWTLTLKNSGSSALTVDAVIHQDLGLADEGAVRNNEAYVSHYIDLLPVRDGARGWSLLARQNQAMSQGRNPWLGVECFPAATSFATDSTQFFGDDHRLTGSADILRRATLPSVRLQGEAACLALQSATSELAPGAEAVVVFRFVFLAHHPAPSEAADLSVFGRAPVTQSPITSQASVRSCPASFFVTAPWIHGEKALEADYGRWFPGTRRHEEREGQELLSFFSGSDTHVVSQTKEARSLRPHGHILRSGASLAMDPVQWGTTLYASGIFGAQAYVGNTSFGRLTSVVRNSLNVARAHGQRLFVELGDETWRQLGVPSAFSMTPGSARWHYKIEEREIVVTVSCHASLPASALHIEVVRGAACRFLLTHHLAVGPVEGEAGCTLVTDTESLVLSVYPSPEGFLAKNEKGACFAIAVAHAEGMLELGGDEPLHADGHHRRGPYATVLSGPVTKVALLHCGTTAGAETLKEVVASARRAYAEGWQASDVPARVVSLRGSASPADVARVSEIVPWFSHNAWIHFTAPHGLEQYGGAAWGVRDVTQGSIEWLLAAGETSAARDTLKIVFQQQYAEGYWPQWFMHAPYRFIQQNHSHGDVCFWPLKALCDYVEASGDLAFLDTLAGYTDTQTFGDAGPVETLLAHCDRIVSHCEARFVPGTCLVNYGDGDWDDTLQPADPKLRTRMVSAWTVGLAYHTFRQYRDVCIRRNDTPRVARLEGLLQGMRRDFERLLMPGGVVAGFMVREEKGDRVLLHPQDSVTGIRYRLLPMTRSILAELFTPAEAKGHLALIREELLCPDGVRLMSHPAQYRGGVEHLFRRAETAANVGREIGLQYVHAHLRYVEALAKVGEAEAAWHQLQIVNPVALQELVANAAPRQANVYFSSSDADFPERYTAAERWDDVRRGKVKVKGGWRLYSSGPGLYLNKLRCSLLGLRESFGDLVVDPVLPRRLDGLEADFVLSGASVRVTYHIAGPGYGPSRVTLNGVEAAWVAEPNPYRKGGVRLSAASLTELLSAEKPAMEVWI